MHFLASAVVKLLLGYVPRYFQWEGGLDGWRMIAIDDTGTDLWTVAWAWEELEGSGVAV